MEKTLLAARHYKTPNLLNETNFYAAFMVL